MTNYLFNLITVIKHVCSETVISADRFNSVTSEITAVWPRSLEMKCLLYSMFSLNESKHENWTCCLLTIIRPGVELLIHIVGWQRSHYTLGELENTNYILMSPFICNCNAPLCLNVNVWVLVLTGVNSSFQPKAQWIKFIRNSFSVSQEIWSDINARRKKKTKTEVHWRPHTHSCNSHVCFSWCVSDIHC